MSVLNLPEPANWAESGRLSIWVKLLLGAGTLYVIVQGVLALLRGSFLTGVVWLGTFGPPFILMWTFFLAAGRELMGSTEIDSTGFTVRPVKWLGILYFTTLAFVLPFAAILAILLPRNMIDISMSRGMQIFAPFAFGALAMLAASGLVAGVQRRGELYIKFTPAMIEISDVLKTRVLEWGDIVDVTDHSETKDGKRAGRSVVLHLRDGSERVVGGLNLYVPRGVALYWLVRHYWKHPEDRMELVDSRAEQRFRDGRFALD